MRKASKLVLCCLLVGFLLFSNSTILVGANDLGIVMPNPKYHEIDKLLTEKALKFNVPPEVVKAIAYRESEWRQFVDGEPNISDDGGIGIMQVTDSRFDQEKLKTDIKYNIESAIQILLEKKKWSGNSIPEINDNSYEYMDHWYFAVMAYNGLVHSNSPIIRATGNRNYSAYQERVFQTISELNNGMVMEPLKFEVADFDYRANNILGFNKMAYKSTGKQSSRYFLNEDDLVITTTTPRLRTSPTTALGNTNIIKTLAEGEILRILETFRYDESHLHGIDNPERQYVWYLVESIDGTEGYVASGTIQPIEEVGLVDINSLPDRNGNELTDIRSHWGKEDILTLNKKDIIRGYSNNTFRPDQNITRAEVMAIISRVLANVPDVNLDWTFSDQKPQDWAKDPIMEGVNLRLIQGYSNNTFRTDNNITRAELVVILDRLVDIVNYEPSGEVGPPEVFVDEIPTWAVDSVNNISRLGIVTGYGDHTFRPSANATRAEVATVIMRILK
ncbi:S-layer homology domain-containing protein [Evansella sp. AB-rgal1]|uniref:S-layer homology domain-containing protein n=1 Tax=Evansella sp. AB-rgal1 TaxID=3242696 RepID=UPI00359ED338